MSREDSVCHTNCIPQLCRRLGWVVNLENISSCHLLRDKVWLQGRLSLSIWDVSISMEFGQLRIGAVQQQLSLMWNQSSDHQSMMVPVNSKDSFQWWLDLKNLRRCIIVCVIQVNHYLYTKSCSIRWGPHLVHRTASTTWEALMKEHQCVGIEGHTDWPSGFCGYVTGFQCCNHVPQCFCHCLCMQSWGTL
jgi:hypothetical protein